MKESSLETQLQRAKEEGKELAEQAKKVGNPAFTPPDSLPLMQEKEPNKFEVLAFQLEELLKKPLVYTNEEGDEIQVAESMEKVFEGEEGRKRLEALGKGVALNAQRATGGDGTNAWYFLLAHTSLTTLPQDAQQTTLDAFKDHSGGKTFEEVLPHILPALGKGMALNAQRATGGDGTSALLFLTAYTSLSTLPQEQQQTTLNTFKAHPNGKLFEEVLPHILPVLGKDMVTKAQRAAGGNGPNAWSFLTTLTSLHTLTAHYHKLAEQQRAEDELHTINTKTTEPIIPPKNF